MSDRFVRPGPSLDLPALEEDVLQRWQAADVPRSVLGRPRDRRFVFFEGPPTANGRPGIHHVLARTLKDVVCRYWAMKGYEVPRKAGWDTHGLPVEIEVQKELGIQIKPEIEEYGIGPFNARCRDSVFRYEKEWVELSERMGYWLDYDHPYVTCANEYISSVWSILARFFDAGLLEKGSRVLPYCPQCGTGLSSHEVAQGYQDVRDPSVFVRFPRRDHAEAFLVWTTTPWTLPSNVALAVHPGLTYARVRRDAEHGGETLVLAEALLEKVFRKEKVEVLETFPGESLVGAKVQRPYDLLPFENGEGEVVVAADFVSAEDGTGIVHIAPAFGLDDHATGETHGLAQLNPVDAEGRFDARMGFLAGQRVHEANDAIAADLKERGLLFRKDQIEHSYPHCWRCKTKLIYWLRPSWYIRTTRLRDQLVEQNGNIEWFPPEIGQGRFGEWLSNNVDWAISRERFWGTPLNLWVCEDCEALQTVHSAAELHEKVPDLPADLDLHRPAIDEVTLPCTACGGTARRTPEVIDCWFDSGAMPFAQAGWHATAGGAPPEHYPADFIAEGLDQTRGWFYTLHVIGTFLTGQPAYRRCLVNNLILDAGRQKMSKSRGNTVDPWEEIRAHGVDAVRWYLLTQSNPWLPKVYDPAALVTSSRDFFGTLWSCYSFFATYANVDGFRPEDGAAPPVAGRPEMDRWILAELARTIESVRERMDAFDLTRGAAALAAFVDRKLSNWYVRRSRSRFWGGDMSEDKRAAYHTLYEVLSQTAVLLAPFAPFFAEGLFGMLRPDAGSVHLVDYPEAEPAHRDPQLEASMDAVLTVVGLGRRARNTAGINNRQPLGKAFVKGPDAAADAVLAGHFGRLAADELNVHELVVAKEDVERLRSLKAKPNFKALGPRLGARMGAGKAAIQKLDTADLSTLLREGAVTLDVGGEEMTFTQAEIEVLLEGKEGFGVETDGYFLVALDTALTEELLVEGLGREIIKRVNNSRRDAGLQVEDRIALVLSGTPRIREAAEQQRDRIAPETLASTLEVQERAPTDSGLKHFDWEIGEERLGVSLRAVPD